MSIEPTSVESSSTTGWDIPEGPRVGVWERSQVHRRCEQAYREKLRGRDPLTQSQPRWRDASRSKVTG
jgi:hypothetical protein